MFVSLFLAFILAVQDQHQLPAPQSLPPDRYEAFLFDSEEGGHRYLFLLRDPASRTRTYTMLAAFETDALGEIVWSTGGTSVSCGSNACGGQCCMTVVGDWIIHSCTCCEGNGKCRLDFLDLKSMPAK